MELLKDYDCTIEYYPGKANMLADALSKKSQDKVTISNLEIPPLQNMLELRKLNVEIQESPTGRLVAHTSVRLILESVLRKSKERTLRERGT